MRNIGIFIGRFQPLHNGHINIIRQALDENEFVIVIIGSKNKNDDRNPFSYEIRKDFILSSISDPKLVVDGLDDFGDYKKWCDELNKVIIKNIFFDLDQCKFRLYGPKKDESTKKYIDYVMNHSIINEYINSEIYTHNDSTLDATLIRKYIQDKNYENCKDLVPKEVINIILNKNI